jgi:hypothetical protein
VSDTTKDAMKENSLLNKKRIAGEKLQRIIKDGIQR